MNPYSLSQAFDIEPDELIRLGVADVSISIDTPLFIDPLLLEESSQLEMQEASRTYRRHFEEVIKLLGTSKRVGDVAWRSAQKRMTFPEIPATCLGYGKASTQGSGIGKGLVEILLETGKEIVDLGVNDPDIFALLALFETGIGADRISDMTVSIIAKDLIDFNNRVLAELNIPTTFFRVGGVDVRLPSNPYLKKPTPILLVPNDVLRPLPTAIDRSEICDAADENEELRNRVNAHLSSIWSQRTKEDRSTLRSQALASKEAFETLLNVYHSIDAEPYDASGDPGGMFGWTKKGVELADEFPLSLQLTSLGDAAKVVSEIISQFKFLVEERGLWKSLYHNGVPLNEDFSQRLFFSVAYSYCKSNNLDVSPEVDTGSGKIDFKFSVGFDTRVIVEIKLSKNKKVVSGYKNQIAKYNEAEETSGGFYVVIDVGGMGIKDKELLRAKASANASGLKQPEIVIVDGLLKKSASKL